MVLSSFDYPKDCKDVHQTKLVFKEAQDDKIDGLGAESMEPS